MGVPFDAGISQLTRRLAHCIEAEARRLELAQLGLHEGEVPPRGGNPLGITDQTGGVEALAEPRRRLGQASLVPGEQTERIVALGQLCLEGPAKLEIES